MAKALALRIESLEAGNVWVWEQDALGADERVVLFRPRLNWSQGGPIIERERIGVEPWGLEMTWLAQTYNSAGRVTFRQYGPTALIAAMRCYVASKLGDEADVPEELCK